MEFSEKLNFLFELTNAEGKSLAAAMNVTPPQISKMRSGVRGLPKSAQSAQTLARFFAQRCDTSLQRDALARAMKTAQVRNIDSENALSKLLLLWLSDDQPRDEQAARSADEFMIRLNAAPAPGVTPRDDARRILRSTGGSISAYYGADGKRMAALGFLQYLQKLGGAYEISILSDESTMWIVESPSYSQQLYGNMVRLAEQGCIFRRIVGPLSDMDQAFESLNRWFPLYMTGKATSYYYKRMRDNLNRVTIFVVPDTAVMFSFSVGTAALQDAVTFFTTDTRTVNSMAARFERYLSLCEPVMHVYSAETTLRQMHACMLEYERCKATCMQTSGSLSFITLPWDIAVSLQGGENQSAKEAFLSSFAQRYKIYKSNLEQFDFIDVLLPADPRDVLAGLVPVPASNILSARPQYYTPQMYLAHLRSILFQLEHRSRYHAVLRKPGTQDVAIVYVKEGFTAVLTRAESPFVIFEVSERYLVDAFAEYLRRMIPADYRTPEFRRGVIREIRGLIRAIESQLGDSAPQ